MRIRSSIAPCVSAGIMPLAASRQRRLPRAFVLVAILIVVMLASMLSLSLLFRLKAEQTASVAGAGSEQAWSAAMSGVREAMRMMTESTAGGLGDQDMTGLFRGRLVFDDGVDHWHFTIYTREPGELGGVRYGLTDEAGKLNLNEASEEMLAKLPRMKPLLTQALLDFIDEDDTPRPEGAEQEYYDALPSPYAIFNAPLSTLDELLLVRGFTPTLLYGEDANQNFRLDANENDSDAHFPPDDQDGKLDPGLRPFLTVVSYDLNQDSEGFPRVNLNSAREDFPTNGLPTGFVTYISALHTNQVVLEHVSELLEAKQSFKDVDGKETELASGIGKDELALVLDRFTATDEEMLPGLINVNVATSQVLQTVPGIDQALAESIVAARGSLPPEKRRTTAWLFEEHIVDADKFKEIAPYLTGRGFQFSFNVVGYGVPSGRYRVLEVIIDVAGGQPRIAYLRDITRLGLPFSIDATDESQPETLASMDGRRHGRGSRAEAGSGRLGRGNEHKRWIIPKHG